MYAWSIRSLDRRLQYFEIYFNNQGVSVEEVKDAVKEKLEGPGRVLRYRAMHKKLRQEHNLYVTRDAVYNAMYVHIRHLLHGLQEGPCSSARISQTGNTVLRSKLSVTTTFNIRRLLLHLR